MKRYLIIILLATVFMLDKSPSFAEKVPLKITPESIVSTDKDVLEVGDWIRFEVVNDIYVNDKLYISKGTPVIGLIDFFHQNGWAGDSAEIRIKSFKTKTVDNQIISIDYPLIIDGNSIKSNDIKTRVSNTAYAFRFVHYAGYLGCLFRGAEINVSQEHHIFNIFIEK